MFLYSANKLLIPGVILSALVTLTACGNSVAGKRADTAATEQRLQVRAVPVDVRELRRNVESVGSLFALEEVAVSSEVEGKVDEVLVDVGDRVETGQPLVNVSTIELKLTLDQQRALYQQARARLGLTEESDDLKNVLDAAEVKKAAADLKEAEEIYKRSQLLLAKLLIPRQDFDQIEARLNAARAAYDLAVQSVQNLRAQLPQYRATVQLAEKKLRDAGLLDTATIERIHEEAHAETEAALEQASSEPKPTPADVERDTYADSAVDAVYPGDYTGLP